MKRTDKWYHRVAGVALVVAFWGLFIYAIAKLGGFV